MAYLKKTVNKKTGRIYLNMVQGYRDKERGHSRTQTLEKFGYLDELEKIYEDPIAHFQNIIDKYNTEKSQEATEYTIIAKKNKELEVNTSTRRNYGYTVILKIFHDLELERLLINRQVRNTKIEYPSHTIMKMLVVSRILTPGSKKDAYERMGRYFDFENSNIFSLHDVYRSLSFFSTLDNDIQTHIHNRIVKQYGRNLDIIYYDVTNYYFEIDKEDELRKKGYSKENRKSPIVQMGLAMDNDGIPISYDIFPGNESEKLHLRPMIFKLRSKFDSRRVIAIADSAQNTGNNVHYLDEGKQGYVFSQSIAGGSKAFKEYVIDEKDYVWYGEEYKRKSRNERRDIQVDFTKKNGKEYKKTVTVDQRQIVFYSEKYAVRSRIKRAELIIKAEKVINNPSAYTKATSYGALKYVMNISTDKETGELIPQGTPYLNMEKLAEEEKYDGYYALVTNIFEEGENKGVYTDDKIIEMYRGLWKIEDTFRVTKSDIESRPVNVSREDHIRAHFLTCFISLVILRLIQKHTDNKYSPAALIETMNNISCSHEGQNVYLFDYRSDISDDLGATFGIDFTKERLTRQEIKKNIGEVK